VRFPGGLRLSRIILVGLCGGAVARGSGGGCRPYSANSGAWNAETVSIRGHTIDPCPAFLKGVQESRKSSTSLLPRGVAARGGA